MLVIVLSGALILTGVLFYQILNFVLNSMMDDSLNEELMEVRDFTHVKNITPAPGDDKNIVINFKGVSRGSHFKIIGDTVFFNPRKQITESGRYLLTDVNVNGSQLQVTIIRSKFPRYRQAQLIFLVVIIPVSILLGVLIVINRYLLNKLWSPFGKIMEQIKTFNLNKAHPYTRVPSAIDEFRELDNTIAEMTSNISEDFREIKLFTENASHEMMTPIAVINSKLDNILQSNSLQEEDSRSLYDLYKATTKLNKINQSLLLLVKIEHNLLTDYQEITVKEAILQKSDFFRELITQRNLTLKISADDTKVLCSKYLFDILLNNLFSNAIRHNTTDGTINVLLSQGRLLFENTGKREALPASEIFGRFYKNPGSEGIGLGLAIIKQICNKHHFGLEYQYKEPFHRFVINLAAPAILIS